MSHTDAQIRHLNRVAEELQARSIRPVYRSYQGLTETQIVRVLRAHDAHCSVDHSDYIIATCAVRDGFVDLVKENAYRASINLRAIGVAS